MKNEHCEDSIRDLIKAIKTDQPKLAAVKCILGRWNFLQQHLIPILIFHQQDKKLSFLAVMLLVQLTEMPVPACEGKPRVDLENNLFDYKEAFLHEKVIQALMSHLADCLQAEVRT